MEEEVSSTQEQRPRLTVIGTGYLGVTHAVCMAVLGFEVLGVDVVPEKVDRLNAGELPFFEPGLPELLRKALDSGRLRFTMDYAEAGSFGDVHFVCVGTPQKPGSHAADMQYVEGSVRALAPHMTRRALIVGKSTVPVGTAAFVRTLARELAPAGDEVELAWNPEFLREGFAVEDTLRPDRLVFGVDSEYAERTLRTVFDAVIEAGTPVVVTDLPTAELVKVAANAFLATKISYINAMAEVCEATGADVKDLAEALSHDSRIGGRFLRPGLGFGGGCLPKDIRAFAHRADELGVGQAVAFLHEVDAINTRRRTNSELSYHAKRDPGRLRYLEISSYHVKPGHNGEWEEIVKMVQAAYDKAGTSAHWAIYDLTFGGEGGMHLVLTGRHSLDEIDQGFAEDKKFGEAIGEEGMKKLEALEASSIDSSSHQLMAVNPRQSYPDDDWVKADPTFWKPKPMSPGAEKKVSLPEKHTTQ